MATSKLISDHLRRRSQFSLLLFLRRPLHSLSHLPSLSSPAPHPHPPHPPSPTTSSSFTNGCPFFFSSSSYTTSFRHFSSQPSDDADFNHAMNSVTESELRNLGFIDGGSQFHGGGLIEDSIFPIRAIVSLLDGYHDVSGLPWWIVIVSSTVAFRITMLPWVLLQLHKLKTIGELFPKLPPPFPPPFSGRSFVDQLSRFRREKQALGGPSFLWFLSSFAVQLPCFFLWMASIRKMSLDHHTGFDTGGILWFQNLTEQPNGVLGPIFPVLIAVLHFCNVQVSFGSSVIGKGTGLLVLLAQYYRRYLQVLTLPLLFIGFYVPQGSLVYWVTNSSLTLIQQLCLQHPVVRQKLGLPDREAVGELSPPDAQGKEKVVTAYMSPREVVDLAIGYLSKGKRDKALALLKLALKEDPECFRASTIMGQALLQQRNYEEATLYLDHAISKISRLGQSIDDETVDFLIQATVSAGAAFFQQGKLDEALAHLESVGEMKEPEPPAVKARYYEGLLILASVLSHVGRKDEAVKYLRMAVAHNPENANLWGNMGHNTDDFLGDLVSSRRGDY